MISQVVLAASTDDARPVLTGVLIEMSGNTMTLAAADGFRLSVRTAQLAEKVPAPARPSSPPGRWPNSAAFCPTARRR